MKDNKSTPKAPEAETTSHRNRHKAEIRAFPEVSRLGDPDPKTASGRFFKERGLWTFLWRSCALAAISIVVMFVALFAAMSSGLSRGEAIALAISVLVISACIVFAVWGTMRGGSVCLNSDWGFAKWISALVMPLPGLASAH